MAKKKRKKYVRKKGSSSSRRTGRKLYKRSYKKRSLFSKIFNSFIAVVSISALILFIVVVISEISNADKSNYKSIMSKFFTRFNVDKVVNLDSLSGGALGEDLPGSKTKNNELLFKICLISDIHQDTENLKKALEKIKTLECRGIFVLGDLTNYGTLESLNEIRGILKEYGIEYRAIPGDHDIAESLGPGNFNNVFGVNYHIVEYEGFGFMIVDNSANYTEIGKSQWSWIESNIESVSFVLLSQPLFVEGLNPPFNSTYMGSMLSPPEGRDIKDKQESVKEQGGLLLDMVRKNDNVRAVISGDHHRSSKLEDSVRSGLTHYVIGAVTNTVNDYPQSAIQTPRFAVLSVFKNGDYRVEDILID